MTTKVIIGSSAGLGKKTKVEVIEYDTAGDPFLKEVKLLNANEFVELYIWNERKIEVTEVDA